MARPAPAPSRSDTEAPAAIELAIRLEYATPTYDRDPVLTATKIHCFGCEQDLSHEPGGRHADLDSKSGV